MWCGEGLETEEAERAQRERCASYKASWSWGLARFPVQEHFSKQSVEKKKRQTIGTSRRRVASGGYVCDIHYCQQRCLVLFLVTRVILTPYFLLEQANLGVICGALHHMLPIQ